MVLVLKKGATKKSIRLLLKNMAEKSKHKGVNVRRFVGKITLKKDALKIQRELRDEWE